MLLVFPCDRHLGVGCEQQARGGCVGKASLTTRVSWPGQHRSCGCFCCREAAGDLCNSVVTAVPEVLLLCVHLGAGTNTEKPPWCSHLKIMSYSVSVLGDFNSGLVSPCRSLGKGFTICPADLAVQVLAFLPGLENSSFVPLIFEIGMYEPKSGWSFRNPSIFIH